MNERPRLLITMGDVAGIGPEIIARSWPGLVDVCQPVVVGDLGCLEHALRLVGSSGRAERVSDPGEKDATLKCVPCFQGTRIDLRQVVPGRVSGAAGQAAYDFLCAAIDRVLAGEADGIVTCPLHKEGLQAAGVPYPGHTEILAERTGTHRFAMMLYMPGLAVIHVTLHMALRDVFRSLTSDAILEKIQLMDEMMPRLIGRRPRIGISALNPHASDGGLFGNEEKQLIEPAIDMARTRSIDVKGPIPSDTLFVRAHDGEFDGVVAMYHDQGHIALKLMGGRRAVNISAGLPIIRTSVAHGTAYDIAGRGVADPTSLGEAARVAAQLAMGTSTAVACAGQRQPGNLPAR
jgi:4-hydroxythreonine-4-phosphate dehydrogenase